jgi:DNA-binding transcriptional MerR regulator
MARSPTGSEKSERAFRTISEAAETIGVPQHVLRFWETRFPQLQPLKRGGNRRYYRPADMELLETIRSMLHDRGLTIRGAKLALTDENAPMRETAYPDMDMAESPAAGIDADPTGNEIVVNLAALRTIRERLRVALAA